MGPGRSVSPTKRTKEEAERMANEAAEEAKVSSAEEVENAMKRCNELKEEIDVKNAELEEAKQVIVDYKEQIDKLLDPESQEQLAAELLDQAAAEEEIMESEVDESERGELENRVKNCKLRSERRKAIVAHVMNKRGVTVDDNWTDEGIGAAFAVLAASAKAKIGNRKPRKAPGSEPVRVRNANTGRSVRPYDGLQEPQGGQVMSIYTGSNNGFMQAAYVDQQGTALPAISPMRPTST